MKKDKSLEFFIKHVPVITVGYKAILTYLIQIILFLFVMLFLWWISQKLLIGALIGEFVVAFSGTIPYIYMANKNKNIREKYRQKYNKLAYQQFWYHYHSWIIPLQSSSLYFPILLYRYDFIPTIVNLPEHFITQNLFSPFISIPLGFAILVLGLIISKSSIKHDKDVVGNRFHLIHPDGSQLIQNGIYKYIRNPQYLSRGIIAVSFGVIANNILAILVGLIHFLSFCVVIPFEDAELGKRFGSDFNKYRENVPALFPRYGNWKKFLIYIYY